MLRCLAEHLLHVFRRGVELAQAVFGFRERRQRVGVPGIEFDRAGQNRFRVGVLLQAVVRDAERQQRQRAVRVRAARRPAVRATAFSLSPTRISATPRR